MGALGSPAVDQSTMYGPSGGALSAAGGGYGLDPATLAMLYGAPGPQSPYAKKLDEASSQILGDPSSLGGALSSAQDKYDSAVNDKLAAIRRAAALISGTRGTANTPLMAFGAGLLHNAPTFATALGNAFDAALPQIQQQREQERYIAQNVGKLGIDEGDTEIGAALEGQGSIEKRLQLAGQLENQAATAQGRADLANARNRSSLMQYEGRIGAAELAQNKNRWQYLGTDPQDPNTGRYLDKNSPDGRVVAGPAIAPKATGTTSTSQWKYNAWLNVHPGDTAGALDFVAGHRSLTQQEISRSAYTDAERELGPGADPADIDARAKEIAGHISGPTSSGQQPPPAGGHAAPQAQPQGGNKMTPDEVKQSRANAQAAIQRNPQARPQILARLKAAGIDTTGL